MDFHAFLHVAARWRDALVDPARRDRTVLVSLAIYVLLWTVYGTIAKSSQGFHPDMTEVIAWSRDLSLGSSQASAVCSLAGSALVYCVPDCRLVLLLAGHADAGHYAVDRLAHVGGLSRCRQTDRRDRTTDVRAVLQLPCAQIQCEYGSAATLGGDHVVFPDVRTHAPDVIGPSLPVSPLRAPCLGNTGRFFCWRDWRWRC